MIKNRTKIITCITEHTEMPVEVINLQNLGDEKLQEICREHCQNYFNCFDGEIKISSEL